MKVLKVFVMMIFVLGTLSARNITMNDFAEPKPTAEDISKSNMIYAMCLEDYKHCSAESIMMVVIKQKILFPQSDYACLIKPLKNIARKAEDEKLRTFAATALLLITENSGLTIDKDMLYNHDTDDFFGFVNGQIGKTILVSSPENTIKN